MTGTVGAPLARRLAARGDQVIGLSRDAVRAHRRVPTLHEAYDWHLPGPPPDDAFAGLDAVVHLAGESVEGRWTPAKRRQIEQSRILGTQRIVDAIERSDPRPAVLVSASGSGYYGDGGERELTEDAPSGEGFLAGVCVGWEREARRAESLGVRVVQLRFGMVLAPAAGALAAMRSIFSAGLGGPIAGGKQWWSWIHVDDAVRLIVFALDHEALRGPVNAVAPAPVRQAEFARTLGRALRRPALLPVPGVAARAAMGAFASEALAGRRVIPERARVAGFEHTHRDLEEALRDLLRQR